MEKPATLDHPLHDLMRRRWSPRAFAAKPVPREALRSVLEAARWAASASNLQPWHFIVARKEDGAEFERALSCLVPFNQGWCKDVPVLMLTVARVINEDGGRNNYAAHDVGQAAAHLTIQAMALGLHVHQMAGIEPARVRELYAVPESHEPLTAIALGYAGNPETLDEKLRQRELAPRQRRAQDEFVFAGRFGQAAGF
ncbi:MAG: nitroreductase family protein [Alphaproteobacteria bacterium]